MSSSVPRCDAPWFSARETVEIRGSWSLVPSHGLGETCARPWTVGARQNSAERSLVYGWYLASGWDAEIRGESIVTRQFVNLGIAVALADGKGLIVPVIRHAEDLNLLGMARQIADIAERARTKKLLPDDVQGGTFTITNPGGFGTFHGTPIISQPQVGILGTYALVKRPWVVQDELGHDVIAIRPMMNITLTYDHRLVDGAYSGQFLRDLRERLENVGRDSSVGARVCAPLAGTRSSAGEPRRFARTAMLG